MYLLEHAGKTDWENADVLAVHSSLLNETCIDDLLVLVQILAGHVAHVKTRNELVHQGLLLRLIGGFFD